MPVCFQCPRCDRLLSTATRKAGRLVACPGCKAPVVVPLLSMPVSSPPGGGWLRPGRLVLVAAVVAVLAALAIPAGDGVAGLTQARLEGDTALSTVASILPTITEQAVSPSSAPQPGRNEPSPTTTQTIPAATASENSRAVIEEASPLVVFVPIAVPEPAPAPVAVAPSVPAVPQTPGACGTGVEFERTPVLAAEQARKERKLLMVLHISGNFEESRFT